MGSARLQSRPSSSTRSANSRRWATAAFDHRAWQSSPRAYPLPDTEAWLRRLKAAGHRLVFLSNMPVPYARHLESAMSARRPTARLLVPAFRIATTPVVPIPRRTRTRVEGTQMR